MRKLYIFGLIALAAVIIGLAWADQMTFTTYYPAPYGVYNNMRVMDRLGVGTTEPTQPLDVIGAAKADSVIFEPKSGDPTTWAAGIEGELAYSDTNDTFYCWDVSSSSWKPALGGAINVAWGTYTGNGGGSTQNINLDYRPKYVYVTGTSMSGRITWGNMTQCAMTDGVGYDTDVLITDQGFRVTDSANYDTYNYIYFVIK